MPRKRFKCPRCSRSFSMAAHLARHKSAMHGAGKRKTGAKRRMKRRAGKRPGRPAGVASRLGLRSMSLDQLAAVIDAARQEAQRKIRALRAAF